MKLKYDIRAEHDVFKDIEANTEECTKEDTFFMATLKYTSDLYDRLIDNILGKKWYSMCWYKNDIDYQAYYYILSKFEALKSQIRILYIIIFILSMIIGGLLLI